jgi:hypothetical protein
MVNSLNTGFHQEDRYTWLFRQATSNGAAASTATKNNEVIRPGSILGMSRGVDHSECVSRLKFEYLMRRPLSTHGERSPIRANRGIHICLTDWIPRSMRNLSARLVCGLRG